MMAPLPYTRATMATLCLAPISGSVDPMDAGEGESLPAVSGTVSLSVCVCVMRFLLSTYNMQDQAITLGWFCHN